MKVSRFIGLTAVLFFTGGCVTTSDNELGEPSKQDAAVYNLQLGMTYMQQGHLDLAKDKLERALEQDPENPEVHIAMAILMYRIGEPKEADKHYRTAIRLDPDNAGAINNYGVFLCQEGRFEEAEEHFQRAARDPLYRTPEAAWTNAGVCARREGDNQKAEGYLRMALGINPRFAEALSQMAELSLAEGNYLPARAFVQRYLESAPGTPQILWVAVQTERELGNKEEAQEFAQRLKREFPTSVETRLLLESERDAG